MTTRVHPMRFGAEVLDDGRIRFHLWAPGANQVELWLGGLAEEITLPMAKEEDGWFGLVTELASVGTLYKFQINGQSKVPDPASRFQPEDVHGPSQVIDPQAFTWQDERWRGRPWEEAVLYELHVGSFTPQGTFAAIKDKLDDLVELGVTAVELMPLADFPGRWNWGYDGVLPFAPDSRYGRPEELKDLIQTMHAKGLMVFIDVVYNHFGPDGNYLHTYAPQFFTDKHHTPWGAAINFDDALSQHVRQFFIDNALYWIKEFHVDGLRFDAVHAIRDDSKPDILEAIAQAVHHGPGRGRSVHLVLENDHNQAQYLTRDDKGDPRAYTAQWNDDAHHVFHVLATQETTGYYADYADEPIRRLGRALTEGFIYQGDPSAFRQGERRGEPSRDLPPLAFVNFLQNHDQVGNRAFGERIAPLAKPEVLRALTAVWLLSPAVPLFFMGQEWGADQPFPFFCDFQGDLARAVTEGRRKEFAGFPAFADPKAQARIPDPNAESTFQSAKLDWAARERTPCHDWFEFHRQLLAVRRNKLTPRLTGIPGGAADFEVLARVVLKVHWTLGDGAKLVLLANLSDQTAFGVDRPAGETIFEVHPAISLPPWSVVAVIKEAD